MYRSSVSSHRQCSRRDFVRYTSFALTAIYGTRARSAPERLWDLIVVGAGTAGLPAAIFAARNGARVLLLEKSDRLGGTLWFSGGQMSAAGTRLQAELGIEDSPELHWRDIQKMSRGTVASPEVSRRSLSSAADTVDWLQAEGISFTDNSPSFGTGHEPYSRRRVYAPVDRGLETLRVLQSAMRGHTEEIDLQLGTDVYELSQDRAGAVDGVIARDHAGRSTRYAGGRVLLASGGVNGNPVLFEDIHGLPLYRESWLPQNTGGGVSMGLDLGGLVTGADAYLCDFGSIPVSTAPPAVEYARSVHHPERRLPWEIAVNSHGVRFVREDEPSVDGRERALMRQPGHSYWLIFDHSVLSRAPDLVTAAPPGKGMWPRSRLLGELGRHPCFKRAETVEGLADLCNLPRDVLISTITSYNASVDSGEDAFGRQHLPQKMTQGPFYAIYHQGGSLISAAGLAVDSKLRVLHRSGSTIPGLYAAGEVLGKGCLSGQCYAGGMMVTPALSFGRIIGQETVRAN